MIVPTDERREYRCSGGDAETRKVYKAGIVLEYCHIVEKKLEPQRVRPLGKGIAVPMLLWNQSAFFIPLQYFLRRIHRLGYRNFSG